MNYVAILVPETYVADMAKTFKVNVYDEAGDFVVQAGDVEVLPNGEAIYTDAEGWSKRFENANEASRTILQSTVVPVPSKLH